jgi:hypothetical protein
MPNRSVKVWIEFVANHTRAAQHALYELASGLPPGSVFRNRLYELSSEVDRLRRDMLACEECRHEDG